MKTKDPFWDIPEETIPPNTIEEDPVPETPENISPPKITTKDDLIKLSKKGFYLYLPPVLALFLIFGSLILISFWQSASRMQAEETMFWALMIFAILSPLINIFVPKWWRNTGLYVVTLIFWFLILDGLLESFSHRSGGGMGEAGLAFILPMMAPFYILPITGFVKFVINAVKKPSPDKK